MASAGLVGPIFSIAVRTKLAMEWPDEFFHLIWPTSILALGTRHVGGLDIAILTATNAVLFAGLAAFIGVLNRLGSNVIVSSLIWILVPIGLEYWFSGGSLSYVNALAFVCALAFYGGLSFLSFTLFRNPDRRL